MQLKYENKYKEKIREYVKKYAQIQMASGKQKEAASQDQQAKMTKKSESSGGSKATKAATADNLSETFHNFQRNNYKIKNR